MKSARLFRLACITLPGLILGGIFCGGPGALAQAREDDGYAIGEERAESAPAVRDAAEEGPVRLARFSYVQGNVTWRADDFAEWSEGTNNLPLRQGAQIWVTEGGRAEIQFDDGSLLRLGNNAVATLQTLYSDADGEFTEIKLTDGLATLRLKHEHSVFQVDTPLASVKAVGPARLRIGAGDGVEVSVRGGTATVEGPQGKVNLKQGDYLDVDNSDAPFAVRSLPRDDSWERWNNDRDALLAAADEDNRVHKLPSNIALVANDLSSYGDWQQEPDYGWVWCPRTTVVDWRPYQYGHWTWVNPFGWTWVSTEPWGWAPYHYGTWTRLGHRWAWVPGPVTQCWSPAVVHFTECDDRVAWCPLAPAEVRYTTALSFGVRGRRWSTYFSIGQAAVYYPTTGGYCAPTIFSTTIINHFSYARSGGGGLNRNGFNNGNAFNGPSGASRFRSSNEYFAANSNTYLNNRFVPINSRSASGVTAADLAQFGGRGRYEGVGQAGAGLFQRGRIVGAPPAGHAPAGGPAAIKPTVQALTPNRSYVADVRGIGKIADRPIYRAQVRPSIEHSSAPVRTLTFDPAGTRMPIERTVSPNGRTSATGQSVVRGRQGESATAQSGNGTSAAGQGAHAAQNGDRETPAQSRARAARQSLGFGGETGRVDDPARRTGGSTGPNSGSGSTGVQPMPGKAIDRRTAMLRPGTIAQARPPATTAEIGREMPIHTACRQCRRQPTHPRAAAGREGPANPGTRKRDVIRHRPRRHRERPRASRVATLASRRRAARSHAAIPHHSSRLRVRRIHAVGRPSLQHGERSREESTRSHPPAGRSHDASQRRSRPLAIQNPGATRALSRRLATRSRAAIQPRRPIRPAARESSRALVTRPRTRPKTRHREDCPAPAEAAADTALGHPRRCSLTRSLTPQPPSPCRPGARAWAGEGGKCAPSTELGEGVRLAAVKVIAVRNLPEYQLQLARELRPRQTVTEPLLWEHLRGKRLAGAKFRRQRPLGRYIADFCCDSARLVVEIDGSVHAATDQQEYDKIRDEVLAARGYTILRITTDEIAADTPAVLVRIAAALKG